MKVSMKEFVRFNLATVSPNHFPACDSGESFVSTGSNIRDAFAEV